MKRNIYQKLHDACLSAKSVKKGAKANGMHFNPLLHDDVQAVATQSLLNNGLYATCNYLTEIVPNIKQVMVVCTMRVYDVDDPTQHILVDGCSAFGNLDKFGTGNAMSYSRKYAFLNLLNLKTGIKDEDGYEPKPFEDSTEQSVEEPTYMDETIDVEDIKHELKSAKSLKDFNIAKEKHRQNVEYLLRNNLRAYRQVTDIAETRETQLNNGQ
nr:Putative single strand-annealing protein [uncultured Mediterranean phage uvMED]